MNLVHNEVNNGDQQYQAIYYCKLALTRQHRGSYWKGIKFETHFHFCKAIWKTNLLIIIIGIKSCLNNRWLNKIACEVRG